jgi:hypothetical protein
MRWLRVVVVARYLTRVILDVSLAHRLLRHLTAAAGAGAGGRSLADGNGVRSQGQPLSCMWSAFDYRLPLPISVSALGDYEAALVSSLVSDDTLTPNRTSDKPAAGMA